MFALPKLSRKTSSRLQINIKGVQEDMLLLPGNRYRAIVEVSPINFELKSEAEQDTINDIYQSFLNSLSFPIQVTVRTRRLEMQKYLDDLQISLKKEKQKVYREQIRSYMKFVQKLLTRHKILTRRFYIVVPAKNADLTAAREQLEVNCDIVAKGLGRLGIHTRRLGTLEILDLFYDSYNHKQAKRQPLVEQTLELLSKSDL